MKSPKAGKREFPDPLVRFISEKCERFSDIYAKSRPTLTEIFPALNVLSHFSPGMVYYLNKITKESQWDVPKESAAASSDGNAEKKIQCAHLLVKHAGSRRPGKCLSFG